MNQEICACSCIFRTGASAPLSTPSPGYLSKREKHPATHYKATPSAWTGRYPATFHPFPILRLSACSLLASQQLPPVKARIISARGTDCFLISSSSLLRTYPMDVLQWQLPEFAFKLPIEISMRSKSAHALSLLRGIISQFH